MSFGTLDPRKLLDSSPPGSRIFYVKVKGEIGPNLIYPFLSRGTNRVHSCPTPELRVYVVTSTIDLRASLNGCSWVESIEEQEIRRSPRERDPKDLQ